MIARTCAAILLAAATLPAVAQEAARPEILDRIGIEQKLGATIPLDLAFRDETGREVRLRDYFGRKPIVMSLNYYECPMLCTLQLNGLTHTARAMTMDIGREFDVLTVSINPKEGPDLAAAKKRVYVDDYGRPSAEEGWHFLTGEEASIRALADAVGFRYAWDEKNKQYAHAAGIMVLTPEGRLARYFYGVEYAPRDLRLGLVEASEGKIGSLADQVLLYCYMYDPATGRYGFAAVASMRIAGLVTAVLLAGWILVQWRRDRGRGSRRAA